jgi:hypothetical protein
MNKYENARKYLISLGAKKSEIRPYFWLFYKLTGIDGKPIVFENPLKILALQSIIGSFIFGVTLWFVEHNTEGFNCLRLFYTSVTFGFISGLFIAASIIFAVRNLKLPSWEQWSK